MTRSLLDVNVLIALLDAAHLDHQTARDWLLDQPEPAWASCAITQNGYVRIVSQPTYPNRTSSASACERLGFACAQVAHEFWPCDVSLLDTEVIDRAALLGPKQVTDAYLLALAVRHSGRLVTFDRGVSVRTVRGASAEHLVAL